MLLIPDRKLSSRYWLSDLTASDTSDRLGIDNSPYALQHQANLERLAGLLERVYSTIGPFSVVSGFRSSELNSAIPGSSTSSLHLSGMAVDIIPQMNYEDFWIKLYASPLRTQLGEITLKRPTQNLHISLPTQNIQGQARIQNSDRSYSTMTMDQINSILSSAGEIVSDNPIKAGLAVFVLLAATGTAVYIIKRR